MCRPSRCCTKHNAPSQRLRGSLSAARLPLPHKNHRHEIHRSHNTAAAQWELREKALKLRLRQSGSPAPLDQASLSIIREVRLGSAAPPCCFVTFHFLWWFVILKKIVLLLWGYVFFLMMIVLLVQVFSDQLLLKDVLSRSDRALAVVKDLFGDGPRRKTGKMHLRCFILSKAKHKC